MKPNIFSVENKVVIVTGASRGNGRAIADGFRVHGAFVYYFDILKESELSTTLEDRRNARYVAGDIRNPSDIDDLVSATMEERDRIDVLVNNAGISLSSNAGCDEDIWDKTFAVNLKGAFLLSNKVAEAMKKQQSGSIINITSLGAELGFPDNPSYVASKGGLKQLTKAMAFDLCKYNIRVNNICPGYFKTNMTQKSYNDPQLKKARDSRMLIRRWGEPSDLVGPCIFLASDASAYITGTDLVVDGGWIAKGL
ncbi:MAG: SDR family oxidoreductase [Bacteroidales bacterium]|nr:SDR family oxidoreductase [Bacteroidales bacterium]